MIPSACRYIRRKKSIDRERIVDEKYNTVPFKLHTTSYDVKIASPLEAGYLTLDIVEDKFEPSFSNLLGKLLGYFIGFHQQGFQYTEYLLKEDTVLTGEILRNI